MLSAWYRHRKWEGGEDRGPPAPFFPLPLPSVPTSRQGGFCVQGQREEMDRLGEARGPPPWPSHAAAAAGAREQPRRCLLDARLRAPQRRRRRRLLGAARVVVVRRFLGAARGAVVVVRRRRRLPAHIDTPVDGEKQGHGVHHGVAGAGRPEDTLVEVRSTSPRLGFVLVMSSPLVLVLTIRFTAPF